ncbi:hypothetical protein AMS68_001864 [Peltaster fructicola]|uniref:Alpha-L-arabinofuranosidase n=1 Tax=Peltaster fructicola TaxID=286661 RepID=A0A6H0XNL1_9PEZI|nr:hypothetical protein AMS68_001864 [Peltaster fructicola]
MLRNIQLSLAAAAALTPVSAAPASLPCDIYAQGNTPCIAAHSTTRALYGSFNGALYQVYRNSDGAATDVYPLSAGGVANAATQDNFCSGSTCLISIIYDQSGTGNHITRAPKGAFSGPQTNGSDDLANPVGAPVTINGQKAYGVFIPPGAGYRNNNAKKTATGDGTEGMYAVLDGTHYNSACCFDYGNAEVSSTDTGDAHMEAIYYGTSTGWGTGNGDGPWIMADLENGLFSGYSAQQNTADPTQSARFLTAIVKGKPNQWAIRGGDATSGSLSTYYSGVRPNGYNPMKEEGAIILGIGGDNSPNAQGTFYEGVMTSGYPSDATENSVQANIAAAKYVPGQLNTGSQLTAGSAISFHVTTPGYTTRYIAHNGSTVDTQVVSSSSSTAVKQSASWNVRTGLGNSNCWSFESVDTPGSFIRHDGFHLLLNGNDGSKQFYEDATFCTQAGLTGSGDSIRSWSYPARYFRHYANVAYVASQGGPNFFDSANSYAPDVTYTIGTTSFN